MKRTQLNRKTSLQSGSKSLKRTPLARGDSQLKRKPLKQKVTRLPGSQEPGDAATERRYRVRRSSRVAVAH
jgi:hypothetical protein